MGGESDDDTPNIDSKVADILRDSSSCVDVAWVSLHSEWMPCRKFCVPWYLA